MAAIAAAAATDYRYISYFVQERDTVKAVAEPCPEALAGSWRLQSETVIFSDTAESIAPHGANPDGWMLLGSVRP